MPWVLLCAGAAAGAPARYLLDRWLGARSVGALPVGTLSVNLLGSLALGVLLGAREAGALSADVLLLLGTGFSGAFTTYSAFAVEVVRLGRERLGAVAVGYALLSPVAALGCAALGYVVGRLA